MNIYFSCSITGGRQDEHAYQAMVDALLSAGHEVPTAHLSDADVMSQEAIVAPEEIYERDIAWVDGCDAVVAEVSTPSHGVGYEIAYALGLGKPVLCCYHQDRRVSKMITGNSHPTLRMLPYQTIPELVEGVTAFLSSVTGSRE
jgi:2'-deoxynucleoside 5'-phosphate N-hydrolase